MMFKQPNRLPEHGAAYSFPRDQLGLSAHQLTGLKAVAHHLLGDAAGYGFGALALGRLAESDGAVWQELPGGTALAQVVSLGLEVTPHPVLGRARVA